MKNIIKKGLVLFLIFVFLLSMVSREDNFVAKLNSNDFISYADGRTVDKNIEIKSDSYIADALFNKADIKKLEKTDIDIADNNQEWTIIRTEETGYINEAVNKFVKEGKRKFYVLEGSYTANGTIHLDKSNIIFRGESRERTRINQINQNADTIAVENCKNTVVRDITVDNRKFGKTSIVYTNVNHCTLDNVRVYGNKSIFSVFFSGPYHNPGQDMLTKVEENRLDDGNKILNCEVTSDFYGDSVAFCGQKNGIVKGNEIYGSQLVMYLCRDSIMENNSITDSNLSGIVYALPAYDNIIRDNKIKNCTHAGIWVQKNQEHEIKDSYRGTNLTIARNTIDNGRHIGILVENMKDSKIVDNIIKTVDMTGICLMKSENLDIIGNRVFAYGHSIKRECLWPWDTNLNSGIYLDHHVKNLVIKDNVIKNTLPGCKYDIYIQSSNDYKTNIIKNNISEKRYNFLMK